MTDKPDYMQNASHGVYMCKTRGGMSEREALMHTPAMQLEALETERAAHEATKAELQALREAVAGIVQSASDLKHLHNCTTAPAYPDTCDCGLTQHRLALRSLLPAPDPDPLVMHVARAISIRATELDAEAPDTCGRLQFILNRDYLLAEAAIKELTRHGLTIAAIGGKHE